MVRIGIVAGEASGDLLGAGLLHALREQVPDMLVEGIGGPRMEAAGCRSLYSMERLAVMGLTEVIGRLRELSRMRSDLVAHFTRQPPDVFIGVDAPDFTLTLERKLRQHGIKTVHYVSPSVWAWRRYRLRKIRRAVDHMLTLFPFEADFYEAQHIPVTFVGHPLADMIPMESDQVAARSVLGLSADGEVVALLPGSRVNEVRNLAPAFIEAARQCLRRRPGLRFVAPMAGPAVRAEFEAVLRHSTDAPPVTLVDGMAQQVMTAADVVLAAGGTAILEAMLLKRPVVMAYKVTPMSYWLAGWLVNVDMFSLPNLLAGKRLIPEFIQDQVTAENLSRAVLEYLENPHQAAALRETFTRLHEQLRRDADHGAARVVRDMLQGAAAGRRA